MATHNQFPEHHIKVCIAVDIVSFASHLALPARLSCQEASVRRVHELGHCNNRLPIGPFGYEKKNLKVIHKRCLENP